MLTLESLTQILRQASLARLKEFQPILAAVMQEFAIITVRRAAAFIAQLGHESGEFRFMEEIWGPTDAQKRYEPVTTLSKKLGNTDPGDGNGSRAVVRFKSPAATTTGVTASYWDWTCSATRNRPRHPKSAFAPRRFSGRRTD